MDKHDDETVERVADRFDHALNVALVAEALLKGFWFSDEKQAVRAARAALSAIPAQDDALEALRELSEASRDVLAERQRQISAEGWTPEHDDEHDGEEMADAAACYASNKALFWAAEYALDVQGGDRATKDFVSYQPLWPWEHHWWKPRDRRRDLVRAGALILAEIERLDRAKLPAPAQEPRS